MRDEQTSVTGNETENGHRAPFVAKYKSSEQKLNSPQKKATFKLEKNEENTMSNHERQQSKLLISFRLIFDFIKNEVHEKKIVLSNFRDVILAISPSTFLTKQYHYVI